MDSSINIETLNTDFGEISYERRDVWGDNFHNSMSDMNQFLTSYPPQYVRTVAMVNTLAFTLYYYCVLIVMYISTGKL